MTNHDLQELNFICALEAKPLARLFEDRFVLDDLKSLGAGVSLALLDFSEERTEAVRLLNKLSIPVTAWLMLPSEQGAWPTLENSATVLERYHAFEQWSQRKKLAWAGIGLGIKTSVNGSFFGPAGKISAEQLAQAQQNYQQLVDQIHADGYHLEVYRPAVTEVVLRSGVKVLRKPVSQLELPAERQVDLLFTSLLRAQPQAGLWRHLSGSQAIGLGMTGASTLFPQAKTSEPLSWQELTQGLRLAARSGKPVYVFSLEGCAKLGYLDRLITFEPAGMDEKQTMSAKKSEHPAAQPRSVLTRRHWAGLAALAGLIGSIMLLRRRKTSK